MAGWKIILKNVIIFLSLLACASAQSTSVSPSPTVSGSIVATTNQTNSSAQVKINSTYSVQTSASTSLINGSSSRGFSSGGSSRDGSSSGGSSSAGSLSGGSSSAQVKINTTSTYSVQASASTLSGGSSSGGHSSGGSSSGGPSSGGSSSGGPSSGGSSSGGPSSGGPSSGGPSSGGSSSGGPSSGGSSSGGPSSGGPSSGGSSSGGSSSETGLAESLKNLNPAQQKMVLAFDNKRKEAISKMEIKTDPKPKETAGEDVIFSSEFQKLFSNAEELGKDFETQLNVSLKYSVIADESAVQVKKYNCLENRLSRFPLSINPKSNGAVANSILLPLECPIIVIKEPSSRKRRDVQISVEMDLDDLPMIDEDPIDYIHVYHYQRTRRAALENQNCLQSIGDNCLENRLNVTMKIKNLNYTSDLANKQSPAYESLKDNITKTLTANITAHNREWYIKPHSFRFSPGSVVAEFYIDHNKGASNLKKYLSGFGSTFGSFVIDHIGVITVDVVNGGWANYSAWPSTSPATYIKCGTNFQVTRERKCSNPSPKNGGKPCTGSNTESKPCVCGGKMKIGDTINSPYWSAHKYPNNADCVWVIEAPFNHTVELTISDFEFEKDKKCFYDFLQIFDGNSTNSSHSLTGRMCGKMGFNKTVKSSDTFMTIHFKSDKSVSEKGFKATTRKVVKPWKPPKPIRYKEQNVTVTNVISCPTYNNSFVPLGKATTCVSKSFDSACYFDAPSYLISCLIGVSTNRGDIPKSNLNFTFKHIMHKELFPSYYLMDKTCVTWDTTLGKGSISAWSKKGCSVESTNISHTTCKCDHTGIFAVLVTEKVVHNELTLLANTYAGIGISFLIVIVAILHIVWKVDIHGGEVMRINICVAIILMMMTFLIGANVKAEKSLCGFLAFLEYYSVLAQFFWLMLHGLRIHGKIKEMFATGMNIEIVYVVFGWGLPLLLSLIAIGIQVDIQNKNDVCWTAIAGGGMWGYGAPLIIVIMLNITVIVAVIVPTTERKTKYDYQPMVYRVLKDATLLALFLITCITAYFTVEQGTFKAQYFLTVSVVLQAVAMFVFGREGRKDFVKRDKEKRVENDNFSQNTNEEMFDKFDDDSSSRSSRQSYLEKSPERKITKKLKEGKEQETCVDA